MSNNQVVFTGLVESSKFTTVTQGPILEPGNDQILIKAVAFAANPTDWKHIAIGWGGHKDDIVGTDVSGVVEKVGSNVTDFKKGDIVSTFLRGNINQERGAFSEYVVADTSTTLKYSQNQIRNEALAVGNAVSSNINSFEGAASITLGLATVAVTFAHNLDISYDKSQNAGKSILIWGGATSTGVLAIQVAKEVYGLEVITTASKANHEYLKSLGADHVIDYKDKDVIEQVRKISKGNIAYAYDTVSTVETLQQTYDATADSKSVAIDNLLFMTGDQIKLDTSRKAKITATVVYFADGRKQYLGGVYNDVPQGLVDNFNHFWKSVAPSLLPKIKATNLKVLPSGLESANDALTLLYENKVNGQKLVFRI